jgi:hypothetical protein
MALGVDYLETTPVRPSSDIAEPLSEFRVQYQNLLRNLESPLVEELKTPCQQAPDEKHKCQDGRDYFFHRPIVALGR